MYIENLRNYIRPGKNAGLEENAKKKKNQQREVLNKTGNERIT
jgi:hypothetical protein